MKHVSVLLKEAIDYLDIKSDGSYMDGTLGRGGHSRAILDRLDERGKLIAFDLDPTAIKEAAGMLDERATVHHGNFADFPAFIEKDSLDGILLDLGVSSPQFDDPDRGFSYRYDAELDMRMDLTQKLTAQEIVSTWSMSEIYRILRDYGEEPYAKRIAEAIVKRREERPIVTTFDLVEVIKSAYPAKALSKKGHPAKQTFQALRIATNAELASLERFLAEFPDYLKGGGTCVIISFHSLEDRLVKRRFRQLTTDTSDRKIMYRPEDIERPPFTMLTRHGIIATDGEVADNPRAKSARLRAIKKEV